MRFPLRRRALFAPLLLFWGATAGRRYLELTHDSLVARCGWFLHYRFPLDEIKQASLISGSVPYAPGWRASALEGRMEYGAVLYSNGVISLVFSQDPVVEVRLKRPVRVRVLVLPLSCHTLAASLEDPGAFLEALAEAGVATTRSE